tara:strand:- start:472 stop:1032 length:561 start_codon:yes stop_codon:yes gene_type:complete
MVSLVVLFGAAEALKDYHLSTITGSAISGEFEIESIKEAIPPTTAVLLRIEDQKLKQDVHNLIEDKDDLSVLLEKITIPAGENEDYLFIEWNNKLNLLSLYMKKEGENEASFEIWGPGNTKIASGELTNNYKWYHFEVSSTKMSSSNYAVFNSGGEGRIYLDKILGINVGENGLAKLTGMMIGRMV